MRKLVVCFAVVIGLLFGGLVSPVPAHAVGPLHQFFYNSSGIQHNVGSYERAELSYQGQYLGFRDLWMHYAPVPTTATMWYGPKSTLVADGNIEVCWLYVNPFLHGPANVTVDFTTGSPATILWSTSFYANPTLGNPYIVRKLCHTLAMFGTFDKFQVRVKVGLTMNIDELDDAFRMYKTTYQDISF